MKDRIRLRDLIKKDTAISWKWRNQKAVKDHFSGHPYAVTQSQEEDWFENTIRQNADLKAFAIEGLEDKVLLGMTFLKNINQHHRQAEFAILIPEEYSGKGIGREALYQTLKYAFKELKVHRIFLKVRIDNKAAISIYTKCGFKLEGELRDDVFKNESFHDTYLMSILESEFE